MGRGAGGASGVFLLTTSLRMWTDLLGGALSGGAKARMMGMERVMGIEPTYSAWKAAALPLSYTRALLRLPERPGARKRAGLTHPRGAGTQAA